MMVKIIFLFYNGLNDSTLFFLEENLMVCLTVFLKIILKTPSFKESS